jgi:hypothetical protein
MAMILVVRRALVTAGTGVRVRSGQADHVLVHVAFVRMMKVALVQVVHVLFVAYRGVTAMGTVLMRMPLVRVVL